MYAYRRGLESIGDSARQAGDAAGARGAYLQAAQALERYLAFRTAAPPRKAVTDDDSIASVYGNLSFMELLAGEFKKCIDAAHHGLALEPDLAWIEQNLAHALLLSGKQDEAIKLYMKIRKARAFNRSMVDATKDDFEVLRALGFTNPAMETILKQMAED